LLMLVGTAMLLFNSYGGSVSMLMVACFVFGFGIGIHNVHLIARIIEHARRGEEGVTASSQSMMRPLGMAVGTAGAGMIANMAGLGAGIEQPSVVSNSVAAVMACSIPPLALAFLFIVRLSRLVVPVGTRESATGRSST